MRRAKDSTQGFSQSSLPPEDSEISKTTEQESSSTAESLISNQISATKFHEEPSGEIRVKSMKSRLIILSFLLPLLLTSASVAKLQEETVSGDGTVTRKTIDSKGGIVIEQFAEGTDGSIPSPSDFRRVEQQETKEKRERLRSSLAVKTLSDTNGT